MAVTLFDLTYEVARALGALRSGTATGGTSTTIVDTVYRDEDDGYFNRGTAWIVSTTDGLAPQGELGVVSNFTASSDTVTLSAALSASVQAGDVYALAKDRYDLPLLRDVVNQALRQLGSIEQTDLSVVTALDTTEYNLPAAAAFDLREVWIEANKTQAANSRPIPVLNWEVDLANAAGGTGKLILYNVLPEGHTLKLVYTALHPKMYKATDILYDAVHPDRVVYAAAREALQFYRDRIRSDEFERRWNQLNALAEEAKVARPLPTPPARQSKVTMPWNIHDDLFSRF